ncbi:MAG TPA: hypothetical protein PKV70_06020, partial [Thermodesulfobacteriota bacterium]|nr:hypothetical protein [Thermodesulfobacteriota bacterium]
MTLTGRARRADRSARAIVPPEYRILHASSTRKAVPSPVSSNVSGAMGGRAERWMSWAATFIVYLLRRS